MDLRPSTRALAALAACSLGVVHAQDFTRIDVEGSTDNTVWSSGGLVAFPNSTIYFRVKATKVGPTPVAGFAAMTFQPILESPSGSFAGVTLLGLSNAANGAGSVNNSGVPANLGRMVPFAAPSMSSVSTPGLLTSSSSTWNSRAILRYSGSRNTSPTTNLAWGVQAAQPRREVAGTVFSTQTSVVLFKFAATLGPSASGFYWADVPLSLMASATSPAAIWYTSLTGGGAPRAFLVDPAASRAFSVYVGAGPCAQSPGLFTRDPLPLSTIPGRRASFEAPALSCGSSSFRWHKDGSPLADGPRVSGSTTTRLTIDPVLSTDAGLYTCRAMFASTPRETRGATLTVRCPGDLDDGSMSAIPDQAVTINDLVFFLIRFEEGAVGADVDDGSTLALPDGAVTIDDLTYFLSRFEEGC